MTRPARLGVLGAVMIAAAGLAGLAWGGQGTAAARSVASGAAAVDLAVTVRADDPRSPVITLTNRGSAACRVATTSLGTLALTRAEQDGKAIEPVGLTGGFPDEVNLMVAQSLRSLEPGAAQELRLLNLPIGPTGQALRTVGWSAGTGPYALAYPVRDGAALALSVTYSVPFTSDGEAVPLCPAALGATTAAGAAGGSAKGGVGEYVPYLIGGAAALALLVSLALLLRRRRPGGPAAKAATGASVVVLVLSLGVVGAIGVGAGRADAKIRITPPNPTAQKALDDCLAKIRANDAQGILPILEADGFDVEIKIVDNQYDVGEDDRKGGALIFWWPEDRHKYQGTGGNADPCTALYHELYHAYQHATGGIEDIGCLSATLPTYANRARGVIPLRELQATLRENELRVKLGLPPRDYYGYDRIPPGFRCIPVEIPGSSTCKYTGCAEAYADPHLITFDGRAYDFQAVGEFVAAQVAGPSGAKAGFAVQIRTQPVLGSRLVSANTAIAADVAGDRVEARLDPEAATGLAVLVNGQPAASQPTISLPHGGTLALTDRLVLTWPDGSLASVVQFGRWGLNLSLQPVPALATRLEGLFGDYDGDSANDIRPAGGGAPIGAVTFDALYPKYADSWRISPTTSLFTYLPNTTTQTYTDRTFPDRAVTPADLPGRVAAEAFCRAHGVVDPSLVEACTLDLALTGQPDFAAGAVAGQRFLAGFGEGSLVKTLAVTKSGATATTKFTATAGEKVFVSIEVPGLPDQCGAVTLFAPGGKSLASACVIGGTGFLDGTVLPDAGEYTLVFDPAGTVTATAHLRIVRDKDVVAPIAIDGDEVAIRLVRWGEAAKVSFPATAGQKVFVAVTHTTLPDDCPLRLLAPNGDAITGGCVISGVGSIDGTVLAQTGTYTIVLDPGARNTGLSIMKVIGVHDVQVPIILNGAPVSVTLKEPGAVGRLTFSGTAGQKVSVEVVSSTLPDECMLSLVAPEGNRFTFGCVIGGKGQIGLATLPTTGTYTILVDPGGTTIGSIELKLKG